MSHYMTNICYSSVISFFKSSEKMYEVSDPLHFLKDQTSHYINKHFFFKKGILQKKKSFLLPICQLPICIIYIIIFYLMHDTNGSDISAALECRIRIFLVT